MSHSLSFKSHAFRVFIGLLSGLVFGAGLIISGMADPKKVIAFLDITGDWDPSLAFVMGGALVVFSPLYHFLIKERETAINKEKFTWTDNCTVDRSLILGSMIFGVGWGLAGFCPGPVIASAVGGSYIVLTFIVSMLIGMFIVNRYK